MAVILLGLGFVALVAIWTDEREELTEDERRCSFERRREGVQAMSEWCNPMWEPMTKNEYKKEYTRLPRPSVLEGMSTVDVECATCGMRRSKLEPGVRMLGLPGKPVCSQCVGR